MPEWISLSRFGNGEDGYFLVGGVAGVEPEEIEVKCPCPHCGADFESDRIEVPAPFFGADNAEESRREVNERYNCENCDGEIEINIDNGFGGMDIEIEKVPRNNISFRHYPAPIDDETG